MIRWKVSAGPGRYNPRPETLSKPPDRLLLLRAGAQAGNTANPGLNHPSRNASEGGGAAAANQKKFILPV